MLVLFGVVWISIVLRGVVTYGVVRLVCIVSVRVGEVVYSYSDLVICSGIVVDLDGLGCGGAGVVGLVSLVGEYGVGVVGSIAVVVSVVSVGLGVVSDMVVVVLVFTALFSVTIERFIDMFTYLLIASMGSL